MQWKDLRKDFCRRLGCEQVPEVADQTKLFFWKRCHLRAYAADAGGGGDCFFLSVAAVLILARASMPAVVDSLGLPPTLAGRDRKAVAKALRGVVGRHFRGLSGKAFVDFVTTVWSVKRLEHGWTNGLCWHYCESHLSSF